MKKITIIGVLLLCILLINGCLEPQYQKNQPVVVAPFNSISIASWNLQIFGESKASNSYVMQQIENKINQYDIIFIQEIRDESGDAFKKLCNDLNRICLISSRSGRSVSKEQYGLIFNNKVKIVGIHDFNPDENDRWERPPYWVTFEFNNERIEVFVLHSKPEDVNKEITALQTIVSKESNAIVLGDLNLDCDYFNENVIVFSGWTSVIPNNSDTTLAATNCAYDRIFITPSLVDNFKGGGVDKNGIDESMSDHYLVYMNLGVDIK